MMRAESGFCACLSVRNVSASPAVPRVRERERVRAHRDLVFGFGRDAAR